MCNYSKGHCSFTAVMSYLQMRTKTAYKNFRMSYRCFGRPVSSLHTPECNRCTIQFVDVSKTWKSYARHKQARFIGYLHM